MTLKLARFDPTPCGFPPPQVPLLPQRPTFSQKTEKASKSAYINRFRHFTRGRYALGEAYRLAGLNEQGALLAPSYHCVTMLDPALNLGGDIVLYPLNADLSPVLEALDALLDKAKKPVKALLATHYFGIVQNFSELKRWCEAQHIALIEDCSHVMFTTSFQAPGTGIHGEYVAASPYKFYPCDDGGLLHLPEAKIPECPETEPASLMGELRGIKGCIQRIFGNAAAMPPDITRIETQLQQLVKMPLTTAKEETVPFIKPTFLFSADAARSRPPACARYIVEHASIREIIDRRRFNFNRWLEAVADLPACQSLYRELPPDCVPYMFPLRIEHPDPHFYWLKQLGVPIWRWDEMAISDYTVAQDYRLHLLHLPCHQSLSEAQMDWMIAAVRKTLECPAQGAV